MKKETTTFHLDEHGRLPPCFFLFRNGEEDGPFSLQELLNLHRAGKLPPSVPCRSRMGKEWHDLGYVLRSVAAEEEEVTVVPPAAGMPAKGSKEESLRSLVAKLVENTQRQNQLLAAIKWCLFLLVLASAGAGVFGLR